MPRQSALGDERKNFCHGSLRSIIWVKCQLYNPKKDSFQGESEVRVWGDCRLGLQEHVRCHGILEPKGSPEWLSDKFKITQLTGVLLGREQGAVLFLNFLSIKRY